MAVECDKGTELLDTGGGAHNVNSSVLSWSFSISNAIVFTRSLSFLSKAHETATALTDGIVCGDAGSTLSYLADKETSGLIETISL